VTDEAIALLAPRIGTRAACRAAGVAQASWHRRHRVSPLAPRPAPVPRKERVQPRALGPAERAAVLDALHSQRFADLAPDEAWATLLDEGAYLGSVSACYRVLREAGESRERRRRAVHPAAVKPGLVATGPNQACSWDITKLRRAHVRAVPELAGKRRRSQEFITHAAAATAPAVRVVASQVPAAPIASSR
jgi:putative transposase